MLEIPSLFRTSSLSAACDIVTMQNKHKADFLLEYAALQMKKNGFGPLTVLQHVAKQFVWGHTPHKHLGGPFTQFHINLKEKNTNLGDISPLPPHTVVQA